MCAWECRYIPERRTFFEGFGEWKAIHSGPAKVKEAAVGELAPDTRHRLRARAVNEAGESSWGPTLEELTLSARKSEKKEEAVVPRSWLSADLADIIAAQRKTEPECDPADFVRSLAADSEPQVLVREMREELGSRLALPPGALTERGKRKRPVVLLPSYSHPVRYASPVSRP